MQILQLFKNWVYFLASSLDILNLSLCWQMDFSNLRNLSDLGERDVSLQKKLCFACRRSQVRSPESPVKILGSRWRDRSLSAWWPLPVRADNIDVDWPRLWFSLAAPCMYLQCHPKHRWTPKPLGFHDLVTLQMMVHKGWNPKYFPGSQLNRIKWELYLSRPTGDYSRVGGLFSLLCQGSAMSSKLPPF